MDRYVIRERRLGVEYPEGNQMIAFSATSTGNNITIPEQVIYRACNTDTPNINMHLGAPGLVALQAPSYPSNVNQAQGQILSGIDPRYLAAYNDNSAGYIATGQFNREYKPIGVNAFGSDYQNRNFIGVERTENSRYAPQRIPNGWHFVLLSF
ncbi:unnamed protein product [Euphydryas editha]|uniref:Capsid protein n=1 Tax=Euphydryas editha TaxID=104508 RepID=A0AAU9UHX9_EUPED|nr:unnamed protein product [Euphydryas editha]